MEERTRSQQFVSAVGIALIVLGGWFLLDGVFGPLLAPFRAMTHVIAEVAWPLALIVLGFVVLTRGRKGSDPAADAQAGSGRRIYRSRTNRVATGLLGGVAAAWRVDAGIVRALFVVLTLAAGFVWGVVLYVVGTLLTPEMPRNLVGAASTPPAPPAYADAPATQVQ